MRAPPTRVSSILRTIESVPSAVPCRIHAFFNGATVSDLIDVYFPLQWVRFTMPDQSTVCGVRAFVRDTRWCEGVYDPGTCRFVVSRATMVLRDEDHDTSRDATLSRIYGLYGTGDVPYADHERLFYATMMLLASTDPMLALQTAEDRARLWLPVQPFDRTVLNLVRCRVVPSHADQ